MSSTNLTPAVDGGILHIQLDVSNLQATVSGRKTNLEVVDKLFL